MAEANETLLLRIQLDEGQTVKQLEKLTLDIESTRTAQKALTQARKEGAISEDEYAKKSVELRTQLREQTKQQTDATKALEAFRNGNQAAEGSINQLRAQLALATQQVNALSEAERNTEGGKALVAKTKEISDALKAAEQANGDFRRNVGNYPDASKGLEALVREMVRLQETQKGLVVGSAEANEMERRRVGFLTAVQQAAARQGKTYEEATNAIENYAKSIQPAVAELVKLEAEQAKIIETGEESTEAYRKIGFQIAAVNKQLEDTPAEADKAGSALGAAGEVAETLGVDVGGLKDAWAKANQGVELAKTGFTGLKGAIASTGIGLLVLALVALFQYFTKTQAGADFLSRKLGALKAVVSVVTNVVADLSETLFKAAENPKQAFSDLVDFIETNLLNRLKSFGVIAQGILDLDPRKVTDGIIQLGTGVEGATGKIQAMGQRLATAADEGERLAQLQRELDRATDDNIDTNKRLLNEVERLKNVRDNEFNTLAARRKANEDAYKVEMEREQTLANLARRRVDILRRQIELEGGRERVSRERYQELKEAENELSDILEDAAGKQNELITNRYQLAKEGQEKEKEAADKAAEARVKAQREALQLEQQRIEQQLLTVQQGSDKELNLLQRKLSIARDLELAQKDVTVGQKKLADLKYETESLKLTADFHRQRNQDALQAEADRVAGELAVAKEGTQQRYELERRQLEVQAELELAALDKRKNNAEKEHAIRAKLSADLAQLAKDNAAAEVERQRQVLAEAAELQNLGADRMLQGLGERQRKEVELSNGYLNARKAAILAERDAQVLGTKEGSAERLRIEQETQQRIFELDEQTAQQRRQELGAQFDEWTQMAQGALSTINTIEEARKNQALARLNEEQQARLRGAQGNAKERAKIEEEFTKKREQLERNAAERSRRIALAQAKINAAAAVVKILAETPKADFGIMTAIQIGLALATSAAQIAAIQGQKFARGGVLQGPSHAAGGIQLYSRSGAHFGEAEGGEPILTAGVSRNPALLAAASAINVAAGGVPLVASGYMALGGIASAGTPVVAPGIDYDRLADAMSKRPIYTRVTDIQTAQSKAAYTEVLANS
ncbi:hypothetical protein [Solirubrum puertoriconensis]|uniref:Uncharacterized protein n=1 Tax=Solirubrum puertoriconensis TaxID=1751427 RepID=A0A9X0HJ69_SOLP1|nr:hypothetical protein [Solirubrum puertoriconensis]KUG06885.1 hypothetical protein ASU33_06050 [Solirubrum puertoriconensis]